MLLLLVGTVGSALALPACTSAGPAAWTSPRPVLVPVAMIPMPPGFEQDGQSAAALRLASRWARIAAIGEQ